MNKKTKIFVVAFLLPPLLVISTAIIIRHYKHHFLPVQRIPAPQLVGYWANANYESNWDESILLGKIKSLPIDRDMTSEQRQKLDSAILTLVNAFHTGTFAEYVKFRMPTDDWQLNESLASFCADKYHLSSLELSQDKRAVFERWWDDAVSNKWANYWDGMSFDSRFASIDTELSPKEFLVDFVSHEKPNAGFAAASGVADLKPSLKELEQKDQNVLCANVSLLPRNRYVSCQVYCRFYWVADSHIWLPDDLMSTYAGKDSGPVLLW